MQVCQRLILVTLVFSRVFSPSVYRKKPASSANSVQPEKRPEMTIYPDSVNVTNTRTNCTYPIYWPSRSSFKNLRLSKIVIFYAPLKFK